MVVYANGTSKRGWRCPPLLVILDMNGVLIVRNTNQRNTGKMRPHLQAFLSTLFEELAGQVQVAVWSSMMQHNLLPLVQTAFGDYADQLQFCWDNSCCTERWVRGSHKPLLRKDLVWLQQTQFSGQVPDRVLLVDDDPAKCTENWAGTAVHPRSLKRMWEESGSWDELSSEDDELLRLAAYIKAVATSGAPSARSYVLQHPYESFELGAADAAPEEELADEPPRKRRAVAPSTAWSAGSYGLEQPRGQAGADVPDTPARKRQATGGGGAASSSAALAPPPLRRGDAVEAYWPDDDVWLGATVAQVFPDGSVTVTWDEDGSESDLTAAYLRRPKPRNPWRRMSSRSKPGTYYYYNQDTGESQAEPPPPWEMFQPSGSSTYYYVNSETGRKSLTKPELSD